MTGTGTTDTRIDLEAVKTLVAANEEIDFTGFNTTEVDANYTNGETIAGDGSTVVEVRYQRNSYMVYVDIDNANAFSAWPESEQSGLYESTLTFDFTLNKGYSLDEETGFEIWAMGENGEEEQVDDVEFTVDSLENAQGTTDFKVTVTIPAKNVTLRVFATNNENTPFTVRYLFQNITLNGYETDENFADQTKYGPTEGKLTEDLIGYTEGMTLDGKPGFVATRHSLVEGNKIAGDGSTVVTIYFDRLTTTITIDRTDLNNGSLVNGQDSLEVLIEGKRKTASEGFTWSVAYGQTVQVSFEMGEGFDFSGFYVNATPYEDPENVNGTSMRYVVDDLGTGEESETILLPVTISFTITAREDIRYVVNVYQQDLEGGYDRPTLTQTFNNGTTNENYTPDMISEMASDLSVFDRYDPEDFVGYEYSGEFSVFATADGVENTDITAFPFIAGDGSTVFNLYFSRKMINVSIEPATPDYIVSVSGNGQYRYGAEVTISAEIKQGYEFDHWDINGEIVRELEHTFTLTSDTDITIYVTAVVGEATYTVEHYYETLSETGGSSYVLRAEYTEQKTGTTESPINIEELLKADAGYSYNHTGEEEYVVNGDGSTVVQIYYTLNMVTFRVTYSAGINSIAVQNAYDRSELAGTFNPETQIYTFTAKYTTRLILRVDLMDGYVLSEWQLNNQIGSIPNSDEADGVFYNVLAEEFTLKAIAIRRPVTIRFNPNNGTSLVIEQSASYGETVILRRNQFTNGNMIFLGWALEEDGEVVYFDQDEVMIDVEGEYLNLYAVWREPEPVVWWPWLLLVILIIIHITFIILLIHRKRVLKREKVRSKQ